MRDSTYADYCRRISDVVGHVSGSLDIPFTVGDLAERCCMSPFHFQRVFGRIAGENCLQFVRRLRLERAAMQLQKSSDSIADVAFRAGFNSHEAFARAFRTMFGSSATEFRNDRWVGYCLPTPTGVHFGVMDATDFVPLGARGHGVPFAVEPVPPFLVAGRRHFGAPHLLAKTAISFAEELKPLGCDIRQVPMIAYAPKLGPGTSLLEVRAYVAVYADAISATGYRRATLGGGSYLVARHDGAGLQLGDFWARMWAEALPASRCALRRAACFQIQRFGLFADDPARFVTTIHIPVQEQKRIFGQVA